MCYSTLDPSIVFLVGLGGGSLVGAGGATLEFYSKKINQEKYPVIRTVAEVFSRTSQTLSFASPFLAIGCAVKNPILSVMSLAISASFFLIPSVNGIVQHHGNETWKKRLSYADGVVSGTSKLFNTIILTGWAYSAGGLLGAVVVGGMVGTVCGLAMEKK